MSGCWVHLTLLSLAFPSPPTQDHAHSRSRHQPPAHQDRPPPCSFLFSLSTTLCTDRLHSQERHGTESWMTQQHARRPPAGQVSFGHVTLFLYSERLSVTTGPECQTRQSQGKLISSLQPPSEPSFHLSWSHSRLPSPVNLLSHGCSTWNIPRHE